MLYISLGNIIDRFHPNMDITTGSADRYTICRFTFIFRFSIPDMEILFPQILSLMYFTFYL